MEAAPKPLQLVETEPPIVRVLDVLGAISSFPNPMDSVRLILYGLGLANSTCNPFIYFFNVGGKRTEGTQDLYLAISNGEGREGIF